MAPPRLSHCQICKSQSSKYSCPSCLIPYCSVICYKDHKSTSCSGTGPAFRPREEERLASPDTQRNPHADRKSEDAVPDAKPLRALTSLKWPYIPEESSFPDPLKRDEPKPLQLRHYQAIATSPEIRSVLSSNPTLKALLRRLNGLRGPDREEALESLLGVENPPSVQHGTIRKRVIQDPGSEDQKAMKQLVEVVEKAVRGENHGTLGLDWAEDSVANAS